MGAANCKTVAKFVAPSSLLLLSDCGRLPGSWSGIRGTLYKRVDTWDTSAGGGEERREGRGMLEEQVEGGGGTTGRAGDGGREDEYEEEENEEGENGEGDRAKEKKEDVQQDPQEEGWEARE